MPTCRRGEAFAVGRVEHGEPDRGVEPAVGVGRVLRDDVLGIHREARCEDLARGLGGLAQPLERGPRSFGVHVVRRDRRDAAPVVDAGVEERREIVAQVGGCLEVHLRTEHQPGRGDGPEVLVGVAGLVAVHRSAGLRQEVLHDDLLHVTVPGVALGDREERVDPLLARLADAHEDPGGERHLRAAGGLERQPAAVRVSCRGRRSAGRPARRGEPRASRSSSPATG